MRHRNTSRVFVAALAIVAAGAHAGTYNFNADTCKHDYSTPFDVDATPEGLSFHRTDGTPEKIFLHDGVLRVDGKAVTISSADADALRRYEKGVRDLMPQIAAIAREGVEVGFSAMTSVTLAFADGDQRGRMLEKLKRKQADALRDIESGIGSGHWSSDRMEELVGGSVADSVGELVGSVTSSAVTAALSGDSSKVAALQARADSLDKTMEREMDKRSKKLEQRANAICPQLNDLAGLQQGWHVRLADGSPLQLMTIKPKSEHKDDEGKEGGRKVVSF